MAPPPAPTTYLTLVSTFTSFLTVAIHTILFERNIYPATTFLTARAYNFPVRQSRHPLVCTWINDAVSAVHAQLLKCTVSRICVVIFEAEGRGSRPLERFVFDVSKWPVVPAGELDTVIVREEAQRREQGGAADKTVNVDGDVEEQFRALMSKLAVCGSRLAPLPANSTFTVTIEMRDAADPPIGHPQPWIPSQTSLQKTMRQRRDETTLGRASAEGEVGQNEVTKGVDLGGVRSLPIRTVEAGEMVFEMWVEEGKAKFEREEASIAGESGSSVVGMSSGEPG